MRRYINSNELSESRTISCEARCVKIFSDLNDVTKLYEKITLNRVSRGNFAIETRSITSDRLKSYTLSVEALSEGVWTLIIAAGAAVIAFLLASLGMRGGGGGSSGGGGSGSSSYSSSSSSSNSSNWGSSSGGSWGSSGNKYSSHSEEDINKGKEKARSTRESAKGLRRHFQRCRELDRTMPNSLENLLHAHALESKETHLSKWINGESVSFSWAAKFNEKYPSSGLDIQKDVPNVEKYAEHIERAYKEFSIKVINDLETTETNGNNSLTVEDFRDTSDVDGQLEYFKKYDALLTTQFGDGRSARYLGNLVIDYKNLIALPEDGYTKPDLHRHFDEEAGSIVGALNMLENTLDSSKKHHESIQKFIGDVNRFNNELQRTKDSTTLVGRYKTAISTYSSSFYRETMETKKFFTTLDRLITKLLGVAQDELRVTIGVYELIQNKCKGTVSSEFKDELSTLRKLLHT